MEWSEREPWFGNTLDLLAPSYAPYIHKARLMPTAWLTALEHGPALENDGRIIVGAWCDKPNIRFDTAAYAVHNARGDTIVIVRMSCLRLHLTDSSPSFSRSVSRDFLFLRKCGRWKRLSFEHPAVQSLPEPPPGVAPVPDWLRQEQYLLKEPQTVVTAWPVTAHVWTGDVIGTLAVPSETQILYSRSGVPLRTYVYFVNRDLVVVGTEWQRWRWERGRYVYSACRVFQRTAQGWAPLPVKPEDLTAMERLEVFL